MATKTTVETVKLVAKTLRDEARALGLTLVGDGRSAGTKQRWADEIKAKKESMAQPKQVASAKAPRGARATSPQTVTVSPAKIVTRTQAFHALDALFDKRNISGILKGKYFLSIEQGQIKVNFRHSACNGISFAKPMVLGSISLSFLSDGTVLYTASGSYIHQIKSSSPDAVVERFAQALGSGRR